MTAPAEWFDVRSLVPWDENPYDHPDRQIDDIVTSIRVNGWGDVIVAHRGTARIVSGHARRLAALRLIGESADWRLPDAPGAGMVPVRFLDGEWSDVCEALAIAANETATRAERQDGRLAAILDRLRKGRTEAPETGVRGAELRRLIAQMQRGRPEGQGAEGGAPDPDADREPDSRAGVVYELGPHRLLCGDSTDPVAVSLLAEGRDVTLIHADPPYGMGKEKDGVENDNLYRANLDAFQMRWWAAWRPYLCANGAAFVWGQAEDLWRWWFTSLSTSERMTLKNEIVWDKGDAARGVLSDEMRSFPIATERCLFFMLGQQSPSANKDDYFDGWEPVRLWLVGERDAAGLTNGDVNRITGTDMAGHWFGTSQWVFITREHYLSLREATGGRHFARAYDEADPAMAKQDAARAEFMPLRAEFMERRAEFMERRAEFMERRAWFDNAHDKMTDVWRFPAVAGDERYGHATPKPVLLTERAIRSACPEGAAVAEPFGGSGTTLIAAARSGRVCLTAEISPAYCDVIRRRWTRYADERGLDAGPGALR